MTQNTLAAALIEGADPTDIIRAKQEQIAAAKREEEATKRFRAECERQMFTPLRNLFQSLVNRGATFGHDKKRILSEEVRQFGVFRKAQPSECDRGLEFYINGHDRFQAAAVLSSRDEPRPHYIVGVRDGPSGGRGKPTVYLTVEEAVNAVLDWFAHNGQMPD